MGTVCSGVRFTFIVFTSFLDLYMLLRNTHTNSLLNGKFKKPRKGKNNDQAHPPIHPVRGATNLEGDEFKLFDFITRRFLACCSDAAKGQTTQVTIEIAQEVFSTSGMRETRRNAKRFFFLFP